MNKKLLSLALTMVLTLILFFPIIAKGISIQSLGPGKTKYVIASTGGGPQTVDPALAYDVASCELVENVYDPLIFFRAASSNTYVPWLATSYTISPDGLTYNFVIRTGVQWQNPVYGTVTPTDVAYSLQRVLVRDYSKGPAWMLWYPIFGLYKATDYGDITQPAVATALGNLINNAITSSASSVTINFQTGKAYTPFLGILAQTLGSIVCKQWCINYGDWNPAVNSLTAGTWVNARNPSSSPLDNPYAMMGSGPFEFNYLISPPNVAWSIIRNGGQAGPGEAADPTPTTSFWGGWGTTRLTNLGISLGPNTQVGYVSEIQENFTSFSTALPGFTSSPPIYDTIAVPRSQMATVWQQPGVKCWYPLNMLYINALLFNYNTSMQSTYIGTPTSPTYFGPNGIRPDFFSDIHCRKAMAYSFNYTQFIQTAYLGEARQPVIPLPTGMQSQFEYAGTLKKYSVNFTKAVEEWQLAWGGGPTPGPVWTNGFTFDIPYIIGNVPMQTAAQMLQAALMMENIAFTVNIVGVSSALYSSALNSTSNGGRSIMPVFTIPWLADFPDVDDFASSFISSKGASLGFAQSVFKDPQSPSMDNLITWGAHNVTDGTTSPYPANSRNYNYQQLWDLYIQQVPSVPLAQPMGRRWGRDWVHGLYYNNPALPGVLGYTIWKGNIFGAGKYATWEDITEDGVVAIKDLATAAKAYGAYFLGKLPPMFPVTPSTPGYPNPQWGTYTANWDSRADVDQDMKVGIKDLSRIAKLYGFVAAPWTPSNSTDY